MPTQLQKTGRALKTAIPEKKRPMDILEKVSGTAVTHFYHFKKIGTTIREVTNERV
jgi:hypothetical protein